MSLPLSAYTKIYLDSPVDKTITRTIVSFEIVYVNVTVYQSAKVSVKLFDPLTNYIYNAVFEMSGDDYKNWTSDDSYIIEWIKTQIINWQIPC